MENGFGLKHGINANPFSKQTRKRLNLTRRQGVKMIIIVSIVVVLLLL